jgi:hypothetical protein
LKEEKSHYDPISEQIQDLKKAAEHKNTVESKIDREAEDQSEEGRNRWLKEVGRRLKQTTSDLRGFEYDFSFAIHAYKHKMVPGTYVYVTQITHEGKPTKNDAFAAAEGMKQINRRVMDHYGVQAPRRADKRDPLAAIKNL